MSETVLASKRLAQLIVADSLNFAFGPRGGGLDHAKFALDVLCGPQGGDLTQSMLVQYLGLSRRSGFDARIIDGGMRTVNINAEELQRQMTEELSASLSFGEAERIAYIKEFGEQS